MIIILLISFLLSVLWASLWCIGVYIAFTPGYIFGDLGNWLEEKLPSYLSKPTFVCVMCMASVHGTAWYAILLSEEFGWWYLLPFVVCVCGLNRLLSNLL